MSQVLIYSEGLLSRLAYRMGVTPEVAKTRANQIANSYYCMLNYFNDDANKAKASIINSPAFGVRIDGNTLNMILNYTQQKQGAGLHSKRQLISTQEDLERRIATNGRRTYFGNMRKAAAVVMLGGSMLFGGYTSVNSDDWYRTQTPAASQPSTPPDAGATQPTQPSTSPATVPTTPQPTQRDIVRMQWIFAQWDKLDENGRKAWKSLHTAVVDLSNKKTKPITKYTGPDLNEYRHCIMPQGSAWICDLVSNVYNDTPQITTKAIAQEIFYKVEGDKVHISASYKVGAPRRPSRVRREAPTQPQVSTDVGGIIYKTEHRKGSGFVEPVQSERLQFGVRGTGTNSGFTFTSEHRRVRN